jgi:hypothetical protein
MFHARTSQSLASGRNLSFWASVALHFFNSQVVVLLCHNMPIPMNANVLVFLAVPVLLLVYWTHVSTF